MKARDSRYRIERFRATSLAGNPLGSPAERELSVYLPPGYDESPSRRYPVIYFLHGYGQDGQHRAVGSRAEARRAFPLLLRLVLRGLLRRLLFFETLDDLIRREELEPFIFVQPDASLHLPHKYGHRQLDGQVITRGSMYTDSPYTGRYRTYVFEEVVGRVDERYRTVADRRGRALVGGSMGGYGALLGGIYYPDRFAAVAALSPAVNCLELLDRTLLIPYRRALLGERRARALGRRDIDDILDTCDRVFSADRPLLPTIVRDGAGRAAAMDRQALKRWAAADLVRMVERVPGAFRGVRLLINCEQNDEYGFAESSRRLHEALRRLGIDHELDIYSDPPAARWSPHTFGIAWRILPAIRFCLDCFKAVPAP